MGGSAKTLRAKAPQPALPVPRTGDRRLRGAQTYAASILEALAKHPRGMTTAELTEHFRELRHPISKRSDAAKAVSNQLSQLKGRNLVVRDPAKALHGGGATEQCEPHRR